MRHLFNIFVLGLAATTTLSAASITLSGASTFGADANGAWTWGITATPSDLGPCCQLSTLEPDTFNNGAGAVTMPSYVLTSGSHTLYLETGNWSAPGANYGVNLYFGGNFSAPGISAFTIATGDKTDFSQGFFADSSTSTASIYNTLVAGSGSLSYTSAGTTVTLTGFQWVPGGGVNPYSTSLSVLRLDLEVSDTAGVPEPATFLLMGPVFLPVAFLRGRSLLRRR